MKVAPDSSAVRTALWRALHVQVDGLPPVLDDEVGLALVDPPTGWQERDDMHPQGTAPYRAGIVARTRYVEDLVVNGGIGQYVLLGAGLDTFAQRRPAAERRIDVFEIDQPGPQEWKRSRLVELGLGVPDHLHLVPVDFEVTDDWWPALVASGFDTAARAIVSSSGVSMYISKDATFATLRQLHSLAPGSTVVMTFMVPLDLADDAERPGLEAASRGAEASGTPWVSFYTAEEMVARAREAGFADVRQMTTAELADPYLAGRTDGLQAPTAERILLARP